MIQPGHEIAIAYLTCRDAAAALDFYARAFGAAEALRLPDDEGRVSHAEIRVGAARIFISDEYPAIGVVSPQALGGTTCSVVLEVPDADVLVAQAAAAGATVTQQVRDDFGGAARVGKLTDPYGHHWIIFAPQG